MNTEHHTHEETHLPKNILTIRCHSGIAGDMLLCGFAVCALSQNNLAIESAEAQAWLNKLVAAVYPPLGDCLKISSRQINGISGYQALVDLPHSHEHRNVRDIKNIIAQSGISETAKHLSCDCFELLAECEAAVHNRPISDVHFHEVGALDSILDICGACELYALLNCPKIICSPLPLADGQINCAHGVLPAPAPAVLRLLKNIPVCPFNGELNAGELITPTGIAILLALGASFGKWPKFKINDATLVYGSKTFAHAVNGTVFAMGESAD